LAVLVLFVAVVHGCVALHLADRMADFSVVQAMPARIEVAYVREMALAAPPAAAPVVRAAAPAPRRAAKRPAKAASAPPAAASVAEPSPPEPRPEPVPEPAVAPQAAPAPAPEPATAVEAAASAPPPSPEATGASAAAASAVTAEPFEWPASTRLSYILTGNYRGEVHGQAQVEWVRADSRYQVHLDVTVGPSFAPLITRRMSSDGELTAQGLSPRRYDEDTKVMFRERRRVTMLFEPDAVVMPGGERRERWPGIQDTASQFVQLAYQFTTQPELLRVGRTVEVPLALPRNVDRWVYEVLDEELLNTPFGPVPSFHLKPRRVTRPGGDLVAEIWFAPELRYLPVRIRIQQDANTFIDLMISRKPELAER
jgi:hypothetical protein